LNTVAVDVALPPVNKNSADKSLPTSIADL
jgi:hypothetical protein